MNNKRIKIGRKLKLTIYSLISLIGIFQKSSQSDTLSDKQYSSVTGTVIQNATNESRQNQWTKELPKDSFSKVEQLSGDSNYYSLVSNASDIPFFRAHYLPPEKVSRLGDQLPENLTSAKKFSLAMAHTYSSNWL